MILLSDVDMVYPNGVHALHNVNFFIDKGEFVFIVGPSGAGKSTLIKLLMHEEVPTSGEIILNNINVGRLKRREIPFLRRNIGVVFQDYRLLNNRTVYENIAFAMHVVGASNREIKRQVQNVLSLVELSHKAQMLPGELSGGEKQRVAIARAIVNNPALIVADEPTGNLNPRVALEVVSLLEEINRRGTTVVMATHAKDIVDSMKKRVIAIEDGIVARDEARGVYGYEN